uniref:Uncharacterized protein n=1 Tax=Siphoviridae sp. ctB3v5 TaxID=2826186 RepID=A0A8S5M912_9CAUD|nr:MAG TPA: hypothetical protein [Siphoviridae sp. ctB3v5]
MKKFHLNQQSPKALFQATFANLLHFPALELISIPN